MTISSIGQPAMDGRISANSANAYASKTPQRPEVKMPMADAAQVVQNISDKNAQLQEDVRQLQKLSDVVSGRKVQFSVNKELNQVVTVVDSKTDKIIKQIPSEDIQKLKVRIRKAIGVLFDEMI